jgi:CBS domain-containing protein
MGEGSLYGGISILLNNAIAIRSLKATEDTYCYVWPKQRFLETCNRFEHFRAYFTDTFGKWMLDRSYAAIVAQMIHPGEKASGHPDQSIEGIYQREIVHCPMDMSIRSVAERMGQHRCSSVLLTDRQGKFIGIVTDSDLRKKVIAVGLDIQEPVAAIMSSPLRGISPKVPIFDALMVMMQQGVKHLAITNAQDTVVGILTNRDILTARGHSPLNLMREIQASDSLDEMAHLHKQLPAVIQHLIRGGAKAEHLTRLITTVSDMILVKILDRTIETIGRPPCRFAFMVLGSEGRKEQTLKTDQDNAIIYEDPPESSAETVRSYFLELGDTVCSRLNQVGYDFCQGGVMAKNPLWCQPVSVWKRYFSNWTHQAEAEDLLQASIFFDFRGGYGDMALVRDLRRYLMETLLGWAGFFRHMTENALYFRPPVGFFRNFVVQSKGEYRDSLDIKSAMMPIIDIIRIYALKYGVAETNTPERMLQLYHRKKLAWEAYNELEHAYGFLMQLRFSRQVHALLIDRTEANNFINPKELTQIERTMLKEIFIRIERMQQHIRFEFIGS